MSYAYFINQRKNAYFSHKDGMLIFFDLYEEAWGIVISKELLKMKMVCCEKKLIQYDARKN